MDMLKESQGNKYVDYLYDIKWADETLSELLINVSEKEMICDIYALPSHNHQTFYGEELFVVSNILIKLL